MAVLVEGIAVVVSLKRLREYLPGGEDAFSRLAYEGLVSRDEELLSVSFEHKSQAVAMAVKLTQNRLPGSRIYLGRDYAIVDQVLGVEGNLPWIEFTIRDSATHGGPVSAAAFRAEGSGPIDWGRENISVPSSWGYASTLRLPMKYERLGLLEASPLSEPYQRHLASEGVAPQRLSAMSDPTAIRAMFEPELAVCLDDYLQTGNKVFAKLHIVLLRALRVVPEPSYSEVEAHLHTLKARVDAIVRELTPIVRRGSSYESRDVMALEAANRLSEAVESFEVLMRASAVTGRARDVAQALVNENGRRRWALGVALSDLHAVDPTIVPLTPSRARG